jgi:hypothetical protein
MNGLPLGLIAFLTTIAIRLAWQHYNTRREENVTMHDLQVTIRARSVRLEALTPAGAMFLDEGGDAPTGTLVCSLSDYQFLVRRAHEVGVVFDVARTAAAVEVAELERMLTVKKEGRK